jgi:hypothetical protein
MYSKVKQVVKNVWKFRFLFLSFIIPSLSVIKNSSVNSMN